MTWEVKYNTLRTFIQTFELDALNWHIKRKKEKASMGLKALIACRRAAEIIEREDITDIEELIKKLVTELKTYKVIIKMGPES